MPPHFSSSLKRRPSPPAWMVRPQGSGAAGTDSDTIEKNTPTGWRGSTYQGGPYFVDYNKTRRAPFLPDLPQALKGIVFSCIRLNMNAVARQPLNLYLATGRGQHKPKHLKTAPIDREQDHKIRSTPWVDRIAKSAEVIERVEDHPLLRAIEWCNPDFNRNKLIRYTVMSLDNVGAAYWWMQPSQRGVGRFGTLDGVWPLLPHYMKPMRSGEHEGTIDHYYYMNGDIYYPKELVRMHWVSPVDPYGAGYGPTQAAFAYVGLADQFVGLQENLMTQGARMSLLLSNKDPNEPLGKAEQEKLSRRVSYDWTRGNTGGIVFIDGAIQADPVTWPPSDLAALKITEAAMEEVARCFGVPLSLLRDSEGNRAVADAGHYQHALLAVDPLCEIISTAFTDWMRAQGQHVERALKARGVNLELNWDRLFWAFDSPVVQDRKEQVAMWTLLQDRGDLTPNEVRAELGKPPVPWGDEPFIAQTLVQPSVAGEQRRLGNERADRLAETRQGQMGGGKGKPGEKPEKDEVGAGRENEEEKPGKPSGNDGGGKDDDKGNGKRKTVDATTVNGVHRNGHADHATDVLGIAIVPPTTKATDAKADRAARDARAAALGQKLADASLDRAGLRNAYDDNTIDPPERLAALHAMRLLCRERLRALAEQALADMLAAEDAEPLPKAIGDRLGKSLGGKARDIARKFFGRAARFIRGSVVGAALLVMGPGTPTQAEIEGIREATAVQMEYLKKFQREVLAGEQGLDGTLAARAEQYGAAVWPAGQSILRKAAIGSRVFTEGLREHNGDDVPCPDCQDEIDKEWHPIDEVLAIGDSRCMNACHCFITWRAADGSEWVAGRGPLAELVGVGELDEVPF